MGTTAALDAWRIIASGDQPGCDVVGAGGNPPATHDLLRG
jgi:hypothetical protein